MNDSLFADVAEVEALADRPLAALYVPLTFDPWVLGGCSRCGHARPLHGPRGFDPTPCVVDGCPCGAMPV